VLRMTAIPCRRITNRMFPRWETYHPPGEVDACRYLALGMPQAQSPSADGSHRQLVLTNVSFTHVYSSYTPCEPMGSVMAFPLIEACA
jgi:hypothetical protein